MSLCNAFSKMSISFELFQKSDNDVLTLFTFSSLETFWHGVNVMN